MAAPYQQDEPGDDDKVTLSTDLLSLNMAAVSLSPFKSFTKCSLRAMLTKSHAQKEILENIVPTELSWQSAKLPHNLWAWVLKLVTMWEEILSPTHGS